MFSFSVLKAIAAESAKMVSDKAIMVFKGREALNERRIGRLLELFKPTLIESEALASNPKFAQLEADVAEMASKIDRTPPKLLVTSHPIGMAAPSDKMMLVSQAELEQSTSQELRALAGHELGHIKRGDHLHFDRPPTHEQELAADRLSVELSGEPEAMISWLERRAKSDPISAQGTLVYPPIAKRIEEILKAGKSGVVRTGHPDIINKSR